MITTNTGAKKLESSDNWREIFPNPGTGTAGAHNATVDAQDRIQAEVAPIINGKQCALGAASGDYVLLRNSTITGKSDGAYIATKAIPANTDIDSTYLGSPITGGMVNELNNNLTQKIPVIHLSVQPGMATQDTFMTIATACKTEMANRGLNTIICAGYYTGVNDFIAICSYTHGYPVIGFYNMGKEAYGFQLAVDGATLTYHKFAEDFNPSSTNNFTVNVPLIVNSSGARCAYFSVPYMKTPVITRINKGGTDVTSEFDLNHNGNGQIFTYSWNTNYSEGDVVSIQYHF